MKWVIIVKSGYAWKLWDGCWNSYDSSDTDWVTAVAVYFRLF